MAATRLVSHLRSVWYAAAVCSEFELKEGRPPVLADLEQLQSRAQQLGREAASQAAADHPGKPLPKETVSEDVLPTEVRVAADPVLFSKHEMGLHEQKRLQSILGRHFSRRLQETVLSCGVIYSKICMAVPCSALGMPGNLAEITGNV